MLITARNLLPVAVAVLVGPAAAGLLKAALLPFTPMLTLFAGLRLVVLPAMQRAAEAGPGQGVRSALDRFTGRLVGWYAAAATVGALGTIAVVTALSAATGELASIDATILRWGGAVAVITVVVRPLAEAVALGTDGFPPVGRRLVEVGIEWACVLGAATVAGPDRVVVGWAVGMALGGSVWVLAALKPGPGGPTADPGGPTAPAGLVRQPPLA